MSHFSVFVIGEDVSAQLQPYHEYECTGIEDQYVVTTDITAEAQERFAEATTTCWKTPDGELVSPFDSRWERPLTAEERAAAESGKPFDVYRAIQAITPNIHGLNSYPGDDARVRVKPDDIEVVEVPTNTLETFQEWAEGYYGGSSVTVDEDDNVKVTDTTNPNAKWDWWVIGGRWSGMLKLKDGTEADQANIEHIDLEGMIAERAASAAETYDKVAAALAEKGMTIDWVSWEEYFKKIDTKNGYTHEQARDEYWAQPQIQALRESKTIDNPFFERDDLLMGREAYLTLKGNAAVAPYALVEDTQWYAKGEMGWWGMSDDNKTQTDWNAEVRAKLESLPPGTMVTVVDCHI